MSKVVRRNPETPLLCQCQKCVAEAESISKTDKRSLCVALGCDCVDNGYWVVDGEAEPGERDSPFGDVVTVKTHLEEVEEMMDLEW